MHEWLPELVMSWVEDAFGLYAVALLHSLSVAILALALWVACRRRASLLISALVMVIAILGMSGSLTPRPHMVTFILTVVVVDAWLQSADDGKARWWLVPVSWVWACSHGMWFIGVVIGLCTVLGSALDRKIPFRTVWRLGSLCLGMILTAALTPVGPSLLLTPLQVGDYTKFVTEWAPPTIGDVFFVAFLLLAGSTALVWIRRGSTTPWSRLVLMGLALALALRFSRTVPIGAAILAPLSAEALQAALTLHREKFGRAEIQLTAALTAAALLAAAAVAPTVARWEGFGARALDSALQSLPPRTVICNDYAIGGWIIWKHPNLRPAIDGRTEIYPVAYVQQYVDFTARKPGWSDFTIRAGCSYALLPTTMPATEALQKEAHWTKSAKGSDYVLLKAPGQVATTSIKTQ